MLRYLAFITIGCATLVAQNPYGRITGRVTDSAGALVPGVTVRVIHESTNVATATASNAEGNYEALNLNPGRYRLVAELSGFKRYERGPIEVRVGDVLNVLVEMEIGTLTESVTVTAEAPLLESTSSSVGQVIDHRRLLDLPLAGGNPLYLAQMAPGVISTNPPTHGWLPHAVDSVSNIATNGTRTRSSEFTLDGIPNMTQSGITSFAPPPEMVQEFRVQTSTFDATVGRFTGAYINMVIKSGSNSPHGNLFFSHVSRPLMTKDFFTNRQIYDTRTGPVTPEKIAAAWPFVRTNRYRANASGPVYLPKIYNGRNRTFWTYGVDVLDRIRPERSSFTVPTAEQRNGDFSSLLALGSQYQLYDPATIAPAASGRFSRQPLPGNRIPASRLDPMARKLMAYYPAPNATGTADGRNNYSDPQPRIIDYHSQTLRVDQSVNESYRFYASLSWSFLEESWGNAFHNETSGLLRNRKHRGIALDHVLTLRPNLILNLRYGLTRFVLDDRPASKGFNLTQLGFPASLVSRLDSAVTSFPDIQIDGYANLGADSGAVPVTNYHTAAGTATYIKGNHSIRFGGEYRLLQENAYNYGAVSPRIEFATLWTRGPLDNSPAAPIGQGLASFLFGLPTTGYIDRNASYAEQSSFYSFFLHDDWKLTRKLTLNLGLRWEYETPTTERYNRSNRGFDFLTSNPIEARARENYARNPIPEIAPQNFRVLGGLLFTGVSGVPRGLWDPDRNNFNPRIGLAYSIRPRMVLRAGYGIFFESLGVDRIDVGQQGFSQRTTLVPSLDNGLTFQATLANPFPAGFIEPAGASGGLATFLGRAPSFALPQRRTGYMQRWSLNIQQEFPHRVLVEAGYVGNRGTGLGVSQNFNALAANYLSKSPVRDQATIDFLSANVRNPFAGMPEFAGTGLQGTNVSRSQLLLPYPHFTSVSATLNDGFSWYHSLQTRVEKRFTHGYTLQVGYTWSKFMEAVERLNPSDLRPHHVISPQDRPHQLTVSGIYELPFGRGRRFLGGLSGWRDHLLGGWSVQGIYQGQSGPPIGFGNIIFTGNLKDIVLPRAERKVERWFNTAAGFETDSRRQLASNIRTFPLRLTGLRADGFNHWDLSAFKHFRLHERLTLQLRAEAQGALNHPLFGSPNTAPTNTLFGQVTGLQGTEQRRIAIGSRLTW